MTDAQLLSGALDKLAALGSPDQIALFLAEQGIKGVQDEVSLCPVAKFVQREIECEVWINPLTSGKAVGHAGFGDDPEFGVSVNLPESVNAFAHAFDNSLYEYLIEEES